MSTEIYYFSGTGNSLHVAKELQQRLPDSHLIPIVRLLPKDVIATSAETVGVVFPIYLTSVPVPVRTFLRKLDLQSSAYMFAVATREGTLALADLQLKKILRKKGKQLDAYALLTMPPSSPSGIKPTPGDKNWVKRITQENIAALESDVQQSLDAIQHAILRREHYPEKPAFRLLHVVLEPLMSLLTERTRSEIQYYTDSTCTGCGICERVCLSNKIIIKHNRPVWQRHIRCYYCYACFNFCPEQSILVKTYAEKQGRYHYPGIMARDIAGQK